MAYHELFKLLRDKNEHCELLELRIVTVNTRPSKYGTGQILDFGDRTRTVVLYCHRNA